MSHLLFHQMLIQLATWTAWTSPRAYWFWLILFHFHAESLEKNIKMLNSFKFTYEMAKSERKRIYCFEVWKLRPLLFQVLSISISNFGSIAKLSLNFIRFSISLIRHCLQITGFWSTNISPKPWNCKIKSDFSQSLQFVGYI